jgi:hypothetical protein
MTEHVARRLSAHRKASLYVALLAAACAGTLAACARPAPSVSTAPPTDGVFQMPQGPSTARSPDEIRADRPAELAEAALHLVNPERPGGADYTAAARLALLATEQADPRGERDLLISCFRFAARSALRAGDAELYLQIVDRWDQAANEVERVSGELAVHTSIRDRLRGAAPATLPSDVLLQRMLGLSAADADGAGSRAAEPRRAR